MSPTPTWNWGDGSLKDVALASGSGARNRDIAARHVHRRARDNPEFPVGTMVEQKNIPHPKVNFSKKVHYPNLKVRETFWVQSQNKHTVRVLLLRPVWGLDSVGSH